MPETRDVMKRYITAAEADRLRQELLVRFLPQCFIDRQFSEGLIGIIPATEYYVVPDNDPRVGTTEKA